MSRTILLVVVLLTLFLVSSARAHYLWLERDGDGPARAYLGEWVEDIREKTGGMLALISGNRGRLCVFKHEM